MKKYNWLPACRQAGLLLSLLVITAVGGSGCGSSTSDTTTTTVATTTTTTTTTATTTTEAPTTTTTTTSTTTITMPMAYTITGTLYAGPCAIPSAEVMLWKGAPNPGGIGLIDRTLEIFFDDGRVDYTLHVTTDEVAPREYLLHAFSPALNGELTEYQTTAIITLEYESTITKNLSYEAPPPLGTLKITGKIYGVEFGGLQVIASTMETFDDLAEGGGYVTEEYIATGETEASFTIGELPDGTYYLFGLLLVGRWDIESGPATGDKVGEYTDNKCPDGWIPSYLGIVDPADIGTPAAIVMNNADVNNIYVTPEAIIP